MRHSNWLIPLSAAASVAALAWLVPAHDIYARLYRPQLTRQEAIKTARLLTKEYGVNTGDWSWAVTSETRGQQSDALSVYPESAVLQSLNPFSLRVLATAPNGDMILTTLGPSGRPVAYQHRLTIAPRPPGPGPGPRPGPPRGNSPGTPPPGPPPRPPDPPRPPPELLERELARYAGPNSGSFRPTTSGVTSQEGTRTVWEWADPGKPGILARFELVTRDGRVVRAAYSDEIAFRLMVRERHRQQLIIGTLIGAMIGIASLIAFLAVWNFFSRMTLRMDHVRFGLPLCLVAGASILPDWLSGNATNLAAFAPLDGGSSAATQLLGTATGSVLTVLAVVLILASGYALLPDRTKPLWVALSLVSQRNLFASSVGREIVLGVLGGVAITGLFYVPAAIPGLARDFVQVAVPSFLVNPLPAVAPLFGLTRVIDFVALFGFFLPWLQNRKWPHWVGATAFGVVGTATLAAVRQPFPHDAAANVLASVLVLAGLTALYRATGILAVWFAGVGMLAALQIATQYVCGAPAYTAQGHHAVVLWGVFLLAAALVWRFGAQADHSVVIDSMRPSGKSVSRSDRDRLLAEFSVARRAQEGMLPLEPPSIPGYSLAACCEPAREVGGDLYDFVAFPDYTWGLCVADVSGKGVPASLYMTLTKGMLVSAAARPPDLRLIASRMNRILAEAGRHRTFVTMSLGFLDAERGVFRHIRAGHNPPLLYTARDRQCRYLMPKGIGLGITAGPAFERNLEVEEIHLVPGDVLVLYSDGLTECMDSTRQLYGEDRLVNILRRNAHLNAIGIQDAILTDARSFRGAADAHDDLTIVVLRAEARDSLR